MRNFDPTLYGLPSLAEIQQWLDDNVQSYPTPKTVTLSDFDINWEELSGSFQLGLDEHRLERRIRFSLDASGRTEFQFPMFHSPLGVPASYKAIELTEETQGAIRQGLQDTIPRVMGLGLNRNTGERLDQRTPLAQRVNDPVAFDAAKERASGSDYSVTVAIDMEATLVS